MRLKRSTLPGFDTVQRIFSYAVWSKWLVGFLFWELTGLLRWTPWKTLSETAWDVEADHPGTKRYLEAFLLGLTIHIRYRTTLESAVAYAHERLQELDEIEEVPTSIRSR